MDNSPLYVDHKVNTNFIVSDERSTDDSHMESKTAFKTRLKEAATAAGFSSRAALASKIGAGENAKQVAQQWVDRENVPDKYRIPLAKLHLSIDYINTGLGGVRDISVPESQVLGIDVEKLSDLLETVEAAVAKSKRLVPPRTKARLVAALYVDEQASAAGSAQAVQAALASILATLEET
jgi:hypothetical protein